MNATKPDTLFQSMEKWIELYRESNKCSEDQAHDAFEVWSEKLRDESADQTTKSFHVAVADEVVEMQSRQFHQQSKLKQCELSSKHMGHVRLEEKHSTSAVENPPNSIIDTIKLIESRKAAKALVRSGLTDNLEPGSASAANKQFQENLERGHQSINGPIAYAKLGSMGSPLLEPGEDPLSFTDANIEIEPSIQRTPVSSPVSSRPTVDMSVDAVRHQAETDISFNTSFLASTKLPMDHPSVLNAQVILGKAKRALELIVGVVERAKERKGKTLKLKGV